MKANILKLDYPEFKQKIAEISSQIKGITVDELIAKDRNYKRIGWVLIVGLFCLISILASLAYFLKLKADDETKNTKERLKQVELLRVKEFLRNAQIFTDAGGDAGKEKAIEMKLKADCIFRAYPNNSEFKNDSLKLYKTLNSIK